MTTTDYRLTMTEVALQDAIVDLAHTLGWSVAHFRAAKSSKGHRTPVQYDAAGFPDLVLVRTRVIFAEVKATRGSLSHDQSAWLQRLSNAGNEVYVWFPSHWVSGQIEKVLRREQ